MSTARIRGIGRVGLYHYDTKTGDGFGAGYTLLQDWTETSGHFAQTSARGNGGNDVRGDGTGCNATAATLYILTNADRSIAS